jgi:hypothetical protein
VLAVALAGIAAFDSPSVRGAKSAVCGEERWEVKTLTDTTTNPGADDVIFANPKSKTVESLRRMNKAGNPSSGKPPAGITGSTPRQAPVETTVYKAKVLLMSLRREDDKDIHLVVADPKVGGSMIVEFPDSSSTVGADPARRADMASALSALTSACDGVPAIGSQAVYTLRGKATLTGVGFFDLVHGQGGVANGVELHPVLSVSGATCTRVQNP